MRELKWTSRKANKNVLLKIHMRERKVCAGSEGRDRRCYEKLLYGFLAGLHRNIYPAICYLNISTWHFFFETRRTLPSLILRVYLFRVSLNWKAHPLLDEILKFEPPPPTGRMRAGVYHALIKYKYFRRTRAVYSCVLLRPFSSYLYDLFLYLDFTLVRQQSTLLCSCSWAENFINRISLFSPPLSLFEYGNLKNKRDKFFFGKFILRCK